MVARLLRLENAFIISPINQHTLVQMAIVLILSTYSVVSGTSLAFPCVSPFLPGSITVYDTICSLSENTTHPSQNAILLRIIWMVFARDFEDGRKGSGVGVDSVSYPVSDMLVD